MSDIIEVKGVTKQYRRGGQELRVLDKLDLAVAQGEFVALMGPSGSGKTTLLNLIGGLDQADGGTIKVGDTVITGLGSSALAAWRSRHVGFVFQSFNLVPVLTALENVMLPLQLQPLSGAKRKEHAEYALGVVGLADRKGHRPKQLSGGQEQRVAIARAIVTDPTLILADEPTGDLDRDSANSILDLLSRLNQEMGKTIVMVTHDSQAADHAARTLHLDKGLLARETRGSKAGGSKNGGAKA